MARIDRLENKPAEAAELVKLLNAEVPPATPGPLDIDVVECLSTESGRIKLAYRAGRRSVVSELCTLYGKDGGDL